MGYSSWGHKESDMIEATEYIDYQLCLPNVHLCTVLGTEDIKVHETGEVPNPGTFAFSILALITYKLTITVAFHVSLSHNSLCLTHSGPMVNIWLVFFFPIKTVLHILPYAQLTDQNSDIYYLMLYFLLHPSLPHT